MGAIVQPGGRASGRRRGGAAARPMSEINVTPFVDVMLVLLIIFMVAAPLLTTGVPVDLPKTNAAALPTEQQEPLMLTIDKDGVIYLQKEPAGARDAAREAGGGARGARQGRRQDLPARRQFAQLRLCAAGAGHGAQRQFRLDQRWSTTSRGKRSSPCGAGAAISGAMHLGLLGLALFGADWFHDREPIPLDLTEIEMVDGRRARRPALDGARGAEQGAGRDGAALARRQRAGARKRRPPSRPTRRPSLRGGGARQGARARAAAGCAEDQPSRRRRRTSLRRRRRLRSPRSRRPTR